MTLEVSPGAAQELLDIRNLLGCDPGEKVITALKEPRDYVAIVTTNKGIPVGISLGIKGADWPPIGDVDLKSRAL